MRHGRGRNLWQKRDVHVRKHRLLPRRKHMDAIIYLVGLVVIVMAILSFFGLR
jgi:hypothetical protein